MSTQKWPDDDLDDLFRKSAEESDPAYNPAAWQDLKARLNDHDRTRFFRWATPALLLLLIAGSLVWYVRQPGTTSVKTAITGSKPISTDATHSSSSLKPDHAVGLAPAAKIMVRSMTTTTTQPADQPVAITEKPKKGTDPQANTPLANRQIATTPYTESHDHRPMTERSPIDEYTPSTASTAFDRITSVAKPIVSRPSARIRTRQTRKQATNRVHLLARTDQRNIVADRMADSPTSTARQDAKTGGLGRHRSRVSGLVNDRFAAENVASNGNTNAAPAATQLTDLSATPTDLLTTVSDRFIWSAPGLLPAKQAQWQVPTVSLPEPIVENSRPAMQRSSRFRLSGLSVQAVLSPDLSTIGLHNFDRPGSNIGVLVQYQLSDRFSVQAGALWSTKLYNTVASEYVWPVNGGMTVWPESISGKCTMVDIPLNLRYDILLRPGGTGRGPVRWFVSGGVTSYFIDREIYDYKYANPDDPAIKYRHWDNKLYGRKGGSFGLSNINVSVGYEQPISRRLSWQIEPFMKIPVQQIGYFKVRLLSTGAFLSLRYRL